MESNAAESVLDLSTRDTVSSNRDQNNTQPAMQHSQHTSQPPSVTVGARGLNHPLPVTHRPLPVTHNVDQWSTGSGEQAMNNTPAGRQVEGDTSNSSGESDDNVDANDDDDPDSGVVTSATSTAPPGPSLPASDLPENTQRHLDTLSTLYRNTAHIVRRHQDGTDTREFCNHLKEIETACNSLDNNCFMLNDSQKRPVNDLLIRTGIVDLLCEVIADGLESNNDAAWDGDQDTNATVIAADGLTAFCWTGCLHEVWCRVCDDARLLPVLLKKLKDWYRPYMDKTLKKLQDSVITSSLHIIFNIARQDDKRERLRQLGVTGVMVNFLTSPDYNCRWQAVSTLHNIVTEEEDDRLESTQIVTSFCDMPHDDSLVWSWKDLTYNAVIKRVLIQKGALPMLMDRVWEADSDDSKHTALHKIDNLCSSEHVPADVRQELLDLAKAIQCYNWESGQCKMTAGEILRKLTSRQGATTIHRQHSTSAAMRHSTAPPGSSLPASDLPENIQRDLATLSTLYRNTAHIVRRHQDGTDTREFCNHLKEIQIACKRFESRCRYTLNDSYMSTVNGLLIRTGIVDLLCEVMADGLESNKDATWDADQDANAAVIAADSISILYAVWRETDWREKDWRENDWREKDWREVWCRVSDDARLLPVLLKKLKDWYRPHMDKTLKKLQDSVINCSLGIIYNMACQDDKREGLRQLGVTGVMVNFLTSPDRVYRKCAVETLIYIMTEEEGDRLESTHIVTSFCDMPDDGGSAGSWRDLTKNAVIKRVLIQKGALLMLMDRVCEVDSVHNKDTALHKINNLCSSEHVPADVRQELLDVAKWIQCNHREFEWCHSTAGEIMKKLTSRQGATTIQRQHSASAEQGTSQRQRAAMAFWLLHAPHWFPDLHNKTYFIPPLDPDSNQNGGDTTAGIVQRKLTETSCSCLRRDPCGLDLQNTDVQPSGYQMHQTTTSGSHEPHPLSDPSPPTKRLKLSSASGRVAYNSSCGSCNIQSAQGQTIAPVVSTGSFQIPSPTPSQQASDVTSVRHHLLRCIRALAERQQEVMMVMWRLDFRRYLDRQDNPLDAATTALLTRSATEGAGNREGDFMMLIIHQKYGLIVVRVTLVGFRMDDVQDVTDKLADAVAEAVKELNAAKRLLKHMTSDLQGVKVTKVIALPCVMSSQLEQALRDTQNVNEIVKMSLCADQLPTARRPCDVINYSDLDRLIEWWKRTMVIPSAASSCDFQGGKRLRRYETLLLRFCVRGTNAVTVIPTATAATREPKSPSPEMMIKARRATPRPSKLSRDRSCTHSFATIANRANEVLEPYKETFGTATHEIDVTRVTQREESGISGNDVEFPALGATTEHLNTSSYDVSEPYSFNMPEIPVDDTLGFIHDTDDKNGEYPDLMNDNNEVIVLSPSQVELLENLPPRVFVTGPPGTGKSSTLFITGSRWLGQIKDVHILSTSETSRAMSFKLQHQLQLSLRNLSLGSSGRSPQVYRHHFCFMEDEMDEAIDALVKVARDAGGQLYLLIDEAGPPKLFPRFCQQLVSRVPTVHLWATALEHGLRPACLTEVRLTIPHRCPWAVLQEISASRALRDGDVYQYDQNVVATEKDATRMKYMFHKHRKNHAAGYPLECEQCGRRLAERLKEFGVAVSDEPGSRQYRDVLILCVRPQDDSRDEHGKVTHASGLVRGLRARGVPVQVVRRLDPDDVIRDVALAINNRVTVADYTMVAGLERRVVVGMGAEGFCSYSNMLAMSRSSGHLLWIDKARAEVKKSFLATQNSS